MRRGPRYSWTYLLAVLLVILMYNFYDRGTDQKVVVRVVDGDTVELNTGEKVRYIGMDTPELHHPKKPVQFLAQEAYQANKKMVEKKRVKLEFDVQQKDQYGRLLAYITPYLSRHSHIL
ncbi:MAG: thermonuclease family protein [Candidatus Atribacteria bacterium]|nr:thermonuclease family protein [Candidatus Atribacteria bacterium]